ncbi:MAG: hypothetical protein RLZZ546_1847 [Bacteroidota bacterium]|jgi:uncharacterized protein YbjT (DUF2867 family)
MIATVIGSTGLVGTALLKLLCQSDEITLINILVRRNSGINHPKIKEIIVDFNDKIALEALLPYGNAIFCCIGTTMKNVKGDKSLYRSIDYDIPIHTAIVAKTRGYKKYLLVSALGADTLSSVFYNKLKGEVENDLAKLGFETTHIFRPSFLLGNRKETRVAENIGKNIFKFLSIIIPSKYRAIYDYQIAKAMLKKSLLNEKGSFIWYYNDMK